MSANISFQLMQGDTPGDLSFEYLRDWKMAYDNLFAITDGETRALRQIELLGERTQRRLARYAEWKIVFQYLAHPSVAKVYRTVSQRIYEVL